tara:strand:+ start:105 stop:557 length:453 start_codon:yes stop_codon:yes gene_type:complete
MKRSELKKMLKPIVKECIQEALYDSGLLSSIIAEVVQGVSAGQKVMTEAQAPVQQAAPPTPKPDNRAREKQAQLRKTKKNLLDSIGKEAYNGVDLFEGTTPLKSGGSPSAATPSQGPFSGVDPSDPGVDIGSLTESLGGVWKKLAQGNKR